MFLFSRAVQLVGDTSSVLPKLLTSVLDPLMSSDSTEYFVLRLAGFCDCDSHRGLLLRAEHNGRDALFQITELLRDTTSVAVKVQCPPHPVDVSVSVPLCL